MIVGSEVLKEQEEWLGLDDHQSGSDNDQPLPRARTHNGSGWNSIRSRSMKLSAQLRLHQTTVATQHLLDSSHIIPTGSGCRSTWLVLAVIAALLSSSVHRGGRRRLLPLSSMMSLLSLAAVFCDVILSGWRTPLLWLLAVRSLSQDGCHLSSSWFLFCRLPQSLVAPSCVPLRQLHDEFFSFSRAGFLNDIITLENFDDQNAACYKHNGAFGKTI